MESQIFLLWQHAGVLGIRSLHFPLPRSYLLYFNISCVVYKVVLKPQFSLSEVVKGLVMLSGNRFITQQEPVCSSAGGEAACRHDSSSMGGLRELLI